MRRSRWRARLWLYGDCGHVEDAKGLDRQPNEEGGTGRGKSRCAAPLAMTVLRLQCGRDAATAVVSSREGFVVCGEN